jgi:hypothetical protein
MRGCGRRARISFYAIAFLYNRAIGPTQIFAIMNQTSTLQTVIESVEALSTEEQDFLFNLIHKRRINQRRQEIAQHATQTLDAVQNGTAQRNTATEIMADLFGDDE